jgi:hypothetical protein
LNLTIIQVTAHDNLLGEVELYAIGTDSPLMKEEVGRADFVYTRVSCDEVLVLRNRHGPTGPMTFAQAQEYIVDVDTADLTYVDGILRHMAQRLQV